ncbi:hypothetical protein GCWU000324_02736 [Kingella oralis ATCC 51147]|uniref:Uncharacterized protein n=1 Tax=Kingella oralis ATCC 51147 TaxID=629741 RepID=C4GM11_9NEIS|nr:hypothetical protein GCWU000324_02736 [Kingella oralis ATCC 51147]
MESRNQQTKTKVWIGLKCWCNSISGSLKCHLTQVKKQTGKKETNKRIWVMIVST